MGPEPARQSHRFLLPLGLCLLTILWGCGSIGAASAAVTHAPVAAPHGADLGRPLASSRLPAGSSAGPLTSVLNLDWSDAFIYYGSSDPAGYLFGQGSVMAVDNAIQNTTTFGGEGVDGLSNITLVWNNGTVGSWAYANSTIAPSPRSNSSFASYENGGFAVLYGGLVSLRSEATTNDTWRYWFVNQTWENVSQRTAPPAREDAAFAIDPTAGIGLLEGGVNPDYSAGASTGSVLWNDTWEIDLATLTWSPVLASPAPPPMYGSSMVWDPVLGDFVLFGGCDALGCTNDVWTMSPSGHQWMVVRAGSGALPSGRGSPSFVWDPVDNVSLLFGGFSPVPGNATALGGTFALAANLSSWSALSNDNAPPPEYDAASAFSDYAGCVGMWVQGGDPAAAGIEYNDYVLQPAIEPGLNCFTPVGGGTSSPPAKCSHQNATVTVQVLDATTDAGLSGSDVVMEGSCGQSSGVTGAAGFLNLSDAAPDSLAIGATHVGFHPGAVNGTLSGYPGQVFSVRLTPFADLHAHVLGRNATGLFPVADAAVDGGAIVLGNTTASGWMNASAPPSLNGSLSVSVTPVDYSTATTSVSLPYTGTAYANLTVEAFGPIDVRLVDALTGAPLSGDPGRLNFVDPLGANSTLFTTNAGGWYNTSLKAGNYTVTEAVTGYFTNATARPFYHPWINTTVVVLGAVPEYGADVDVQVLNEVLATPVPNATVDFGGAATVLDDARGWANATNLGPPGFLTIRGSAPGFYPNTTTISIAPYAVLPLVLHLTPAPPCSAFAACPPKPPTPPAFVGLSFFPNPGPARDLLLLAPAALVVAGAVYLLLVVRRADPPGAGGVPGGASGEVYPRRPTPPSPSEGLWVRR